MLDDLMVDTHGGGHHRTTARHVLDQLIAAFAALPRFIRQWHDADIETLHLGDLGLFRPPSYDEWYTIESDVRRTADHDQTPAVVLANVLQGWTHLTQVRRGSRGTDPADSKEIGRASCRERV